MEEPYLDSEETNGWLDLMGVIQSIFQFVAPVVGLILVILLFIKGIAWYWETAYPILNAILAVLIILLFPAGLVLAIFRKTRGFAGLLVTTSGFLYFCAIWTQALAFAYVFAGKIWMIIGFLLAGVGVFFIATIGALIQGEFFSAAMIVVSIAIFFGVYSFGIFLCSKGPSTEWNRRRGPRGHNIEDAKLNG